LYMWTCNMARPVCVIRHKNSDYEVKKERGDQCT
jgi:hypothetical protein